MSLPVHVQGRSGTRRRGPVRRFLEVRGAVGGYRQPHPLARLRAADGTRLTGTYLHGPAASVPAALLVHGFAAHRRKPAYALLAEALSAHVHVLALDLRGHGQSAGRCTLGDREALDVAAGVRWLRGFGHRHVTAIGVSMGGTAALHAAASGMARPDTAVVVSTPARLFGHDTAPIRRLLDVWHTPWKRVGLDVLLNVGVVPPAGWQAPPDPVVAAAPLDIPLLVVHGEDDPYFPVSDAKHLAAAAGSGATLWRRPAGFGHAEDGLDPTFATRLGRAVAAAATTGRFPTWQELVPTASAAAHRPSGTG